METIKAANKIIKEGIALLPDDAKKDFMSRMNAELPINEAISNACGALNEDAEKTAMLKAYAVQEANRVASTLWRLNLITPELEMEYRQLPPQEEMAANYNEFLDARNARVDEIMAKDKEIRDEKRELEIFMGIINGVSAADAEKEYDAFQKKQMQAMAGGR